ncbi:TrlF family AAA-like ATPase [Glaciecola siphonariae]|uniref:TrlF family AAA-like ATPase n=1 Tax=Glaciecola siphonariae TaxID=521012 RepID=A0ABV9M0X9_9ALTE
MMDNGNHFKKCDLQVHTPRDRNWSQTNCITEYERETYAKAFVKECRIAGLDAVAITDHHDLVFFEYIKVAAKTELDDNGELVSIDNQLIVFPGLELTLHQPPIQGLLILDANFPEQLFPTVLGALGIAQAPKKDSKTAPTTPISNDTISGIEQLYKKLDGTDGLKGRYIFLPHVKDSGHKTLMRSGFHEAYSKMPSVGGYVDGLFKSTNRGYLKIIAGLVPEWGNKSIATLQTSDYRANKTIGEIGVATWIKWKEPTAEALRQACLAQESRISLLEPELPHIFIEKIDVTNSSFLSKFNLDFNSQLNAIIGGRGSGKSTILEYLRWALCDQTIDFGSDATKSDIQKRRETLIDKTLRAVGGEVRIFFSVNGTRHIVKRSPMSEDVSLKVGNGNFESVKPHQIQDLLPIQAYSQKQLSSISIKTDELKRFIERPISKEISSIDFEIDETFRKVKTTYIKLASSKEIRSDLKKSEIEIDSFKSQIEQLRSGLAGLSENDKAVLSKAKLFVNEKNLLDEISLEILSVKSAIAALTEIINKTRNVGSDKTILFENNSIIDTLSNTRKQYLDSMLETLEALEIKQAEYERAYEETKGEWLIIRNSFEERYRSAKSNSTASATTLESVKELEQKIEKLELSIRKKKSLLSEYDVTGDDLDKLFTEYVSHQEKKVKKLTESTNMFTELSDGHIEADFTKTVDVEALAQQINAVFSSNSLGIQKTKVESLVAIIAESPNPISEWTKVIYEIKALSEFSVSVDPKDELPITPIIEGAKFNAGNKRKISESLQQDGMIRLAEIRLGFLPRFFYKTFNEMGDKIPFEEASAGQQATALLNVLFNQDGFPLIIDQPEDDIDNRAIERIIEKLWGSKKKRQIIISSHNANLVVNGDSELVVCCDYNSTSEQTKGHIKYEGSIDSNDIRQEITSIMEGGERAFKLRKAKYGF